MKAIFILGPSCSGKSTFIKNHIPSYYKVVNIDDEYEKLLISNKLGLNVGEFTPDQLSTAGSLMQQAIKLTKIKEDNLIKNKQNIVFDTVGSSYKKIKEKTEILNKKGYSIIIIFLYIDPKESLIRNSKRSRKLITSSVLNSWVKSVNNILPLRKEFPLFYILKLDNNNHHFNPLSIYKEFPNPPGKPKSKEEQFKTEREKIKINQQIAHDVEIFRYFKFNSITQAKEYIK